MINGDNKQAFLIVTNRISKDVVKRYHKLRKAAEELGDVFLLYHTNDNKILTGFEEIKIEIFTDEILHNLDYKPIRKTLVPGSNHFPVLKFFLDHPHYTHYWSIEDDVAFNGNWKDFFENASLKDFDFISSHIRKHSDMPRWSWWYTLKGPEGKFSAEKLYSSFNPLYKISNKALQYINTCLRNGYSGHHEVLLPSLLFKAGFKIADFGAQDNHITPWLSYCTLSTMRWKPIFFFKGIKKNKLYHPVKEKFTFKDILVFVKKTILNRKNYYNLKNGKNLHFLIKSCFFDILNTDLKRLKM